MFTAFSKTIGTELNNNMPVIHPSKHITSRGRHHPTPEAHAAN